MNFVIGDHYYVDIHTTYYCVFFFSGQITSVPSSTTINVGENIPITCDSGNNALTHNLLIDSNSPGSRVTDVTNNNNLRVFLFSFAICEDNRIILTYLDITGSLTLNVSCEFN